MIAVFVMGIIKADRKSMILLFCGPIFAKLATPLQW